MKLTLLYEDYWQPIADHPGQLGKLDKRAKKNDKSFLVHPEDRQRWLKWFGAKNIKEDLDDKDEFNKYPTISSAYFNNSGRKRLVVNFEDGSQAYMLAKSPKFDSDYYWKFRNGHGQINSNVPKEYVAAVVHNSAYDRFTPEIWADWKDAFKELL